MADKTASTLQGAAKAATYNMILQVSFRLVTFAMNAVILRYISRELLGIVNVRLTLVYSTILFLSREAFRKACLTKTEKEKKWNEIITLIWFTVPVGILFAIMSCAVWIRLLEWPSESYKELYPVSVMVFALSAVLELTTEPLYVVAQQYLFIRSRVVIEGLALAFRCGITVILVVILPERNLKSFCFAQLAHSLVYVASYYLFFLFYVTSIAKEEIAKDFPFKRPRDFFPFISAVSGQARLYARLVLSFLTQSLLKQFLTEGERYIMTLFNVLTFAQQGVYDVINNLGSLVARFVFLPIEDSYYTFFSQTLIRGKYARQQEKEAVEISAKVLCMVLKFVLLLGITILTFGFSYSYLLLDIYGGKILSSEEGPNLLRWYCLYVLIIAINGITECFMFATMSQEQVDNYNKKMLLFSLCFLTSTFLLTSIIGSAGFILANCLNMTLRIYHSVQFIGQFFSATQYRPLNNAVPHKIVLFCYGLAAVITAISEQLFCCEQGIKFAILHIFIGMCCLLAVALSVFIVEKDFLIFLKDQWTGKLKKD